MPTGMTKEEMDYINSIQEGSYIKNPGNSATVFKLPTFIFNKKVHILERMRFATFFTGMYLVVFVVTYSIAKEFFK